MTAEQSLTHFESRLDPAIVKFYRADRWMHNASWNSAHNVVPIRRRAAIFPITNCLTRSSFSFLSLLSRSISTCDEHTCRMAVPLPDGGTDSLGHRAVRYVNDTSLCADACRNCFCEASKAYVEGNTVTYAALQILYYMGCGRVCAWVRNRPVKHPCFASSPVDRRVCVHGLNSIRTSTQISSASTTPSSRRAKRTRRK